MEVTPGENYTLECDVEMGADTTTQWLQFCNDIPLVVVKQKEARFKFEPSRERNCQNLEITNITMAELCLYNSAKAKKEDKELKYKYEFGERFTRVKLKGKANRFNEVLIT